MRHCRLVRNLLVLSVCATLLLSACGTAPLRDDVYLVRSGDTLYSIATRAGTSYRELARLNNIGSDYRIYPGQTLRLRGASRSAQPASATRNPVTADHQVSISWIWPTHAQQYAPTTRPNGGTGLLINGVAGQEIVAAAPGSVLYSGSGLLGYGRLLIVKHDAVHLSVYAQLQQVLVTEGEPVAAGQKIATMGHDSTGNALLYFEIRVSGLPVEPLPMLQKQK